MMTEFKEFTLASNYYLRGRIVEVDNDGLFNIRPTKKKINANLISFDGKYPYVARGTESNGIRGKINYDTRYLNPGNTISFGQDTATMYYQENAYFTGDKIQIFNLNPKLGFVLNYRIAIYLITVARKLFTNFSWGQSSFAVDKIAYMKINLPVISGTNKIDFKFMEERVKALEQDRVKKLDNYLMDTGLNNCKLTDEDRKVLSYKPKYKDFKIEEIFSKPGKGDVDLQQSDVNNKGEYFINSGETNQGIKGKTNRPARIFPANSITIDFFGNAYYRDFSYKLATHNHVFSFDDPIIRNKEIGLYLVSSLKYLTNNFSYDNMLTWKKLKKMTITLPVISSTTDIDFEYMEKYIKAIQKLTIKNVVDYKDKIISKIIS